jgi:membrane fusion protein (multidrug efflux system)
MSDTAAPAAPAAPSNGKRRIVLTIIGLIFAVIGIGWLILWFLVLSLRETTDDAYVGGNLVTISSQVQGTVIALLADDTQRVQAGQVLVRLEPTDAEVALNQAAAVLAQAVRQVRQQTSTADSYDAEVDSRRHQLALAEADLKRRQPLLADQAIGAEELKHAETTVEVARSALLAAERQAAAAHVLVNGSNVAVQPAVLQAKAAYVQAWVANRRNTIIAPTSGYVAQRTVQVGQRLQPGQTLMTVIPLNALWVDANFKEVQLRHLRIGQPARLRSDLYGGEAIFNGRVIGMAPGTGAAFALLPAQNASGNWIKVVQRVPVRIGLDPDQLQQHPLRIGLSVDVNVDTKDTSGPMLAAAPTNAAVADTNVYVNDLADAQKDADAIIAANLSGAAQG